MAIALRPPSPGAVTSGFGNRTGGFHEGIDFGWGNGWTITAAAGGTVVHAGPGGVYGARYGSLTIIDHGGFQTRYAHQSRIDVARGESVSAGQAIGVIGGSGAKGANTYAPHLHFELLIGGNKVNPATYFGSTAGDNITPIGDDDMTPDQANKLEAVYQALWNGGSNKVDGVVMKYNYGVLHMAVANQELIARLIREQSGLLSAINALSVGTGVDPAAVIAAAREGAAAAVKDLNIPTVAQIDAALTDDFAKVHANIDDQPTVFEIRPKA